MIAATRPTPQVNLTISNDPLSIFLDNSNIRSLFSVDSPSDRILIKMTKLAKPQSMARPQNTQTNTIKPTLASGAIPSGVDDFNSSSIWVCGWISDRLYIES